VDTCYKAATKVPNEEQDDAAFETSTSSCESHLLTQGKLNDFVRDIKLAKKKNRPKFWVLG
jgi:hypothetical protein